jgi:tRNA(Arg) A34 adenosine deaminase TadA
MGDARTHRRKDSTVTFDPTPDDVRLLRRAVELALEGRAAGQAPFGSLLAGPDGTVLAEDHNTVRADGDITAHPELKLARWAARNLDRATAAGVTLYTSCQPCGMCSGALDRSGIGRVVYALSNEQYAAENPGGLFPHVPQLGPGLPDEGRAAVAGYAP